MHSAIRWRWHPALGRASAELSVSVNTASPLEPGNSTMPGASSVISLHQYMCYTGRNNRNMTRETASA
jgi:hypothetical protein